MKTKTFYFWMWANAVLAAINSGLYIWGSSNWINLLSGAASFGIFIKMWDAE